MLLHTIIYAFYCEVIQMAIGHVRSVVNRTLLSLSVSICLGISTQSYAQQDTTDLPIMNSSILVSSAAAGGADASEAYTFQFIYDQAVKTDNKELLALISAATSDKERAMLAGELTPDRSGMTVKGALISQDLFARAVQRRTSDFLFGDSAQRASCPSQIMRSELTQRLPFFLREPIAQRQYLIDGCGTHWQIRIVPGRKDVF